MSQGPGGADVHQRAGTPRLWREQSRASLRSLRAAARGLIVPVLRGWWSNPLLVHARHQMPLALGRIRVGVIGAGGALALLSIGAWLGGWRSIGAVLTGLSLGGVLAPALIAPVAGADRIARQMRYSRLDPRRLTDLDPSEVAWGLVLVTLWRLRWWIAAGLALTPVLVIGVLRLDVATFNVWRESAGALGETAEARARFLRPDGGLPIFRLAVRALSAGITPWAALPLLASLGVAAALALDDPSLSPLAALIGEALAVPILALVWNFVGRTPLLAGSLEVVRLVLLTGLWVGLGALAAWVNRRSAAVLAAGVVPAGTPDGDQAS